MSDELQVGTVVQLKSGGPSMTVISRVPSKGEDSLTLCRCLFFAGDRMQEAMVPEAALKVTKDG